MRFPGRAPLMAVSVATTLPAQPAIGLNTYVPLGGDGWTAPHSVAEFSISSVGAAGGGNNTITLTFDPRFTSIVSYVRLVNAGASAAIEMLLRMRPPLPRVQPQVEAFANQAGVLSLFTQNLFTWAPPPLPHMGILEGVTTNVDGDTLSMMGYIYQFQVDVLQKVPLNFVLAALPRGDSQVPLTAG